jgi:hypothetical protein
VEQLSAYRSRDQLRCNEFRTTDQKVGGSNPSRRTPQSGCNAADLTSSSMYAMFRHPIDDPIEPPVVAGQTPGAARDRERCFYACRMRNTRGSGSVRERRAGVWEVRVALGPDLVSGRSRYRSITVRGSRTAAETARAWWAAKAELVRSTGRSRPGIAIGRLLGEWLPADHDWRPSTVSGYRSVARLLAGDRISGRRAVDLTPKVMTATCAAWRNEGSPEPTVSGRVRVLRSALGWAHVEGILDVFPLDGMHGPPHAGVRRHGRSTTCSPSPSLRPGRRPRRRPARRSAGVRPTEGVPQQPLAREH